MAASVVGFSIVAWLGGAGCGGSGSGGHAAAGSGGASSEAGPPDAGQAGDAAGGATGDASGGATGDAAQGDAAQGDGSVDDAGPGQDGGSDAATDSGIDPCSPSACSVDSDSDGIPDFVEGRCAAGGPTDTDGDGTPDYLDTDSDGDTIPDSVEWAAGGCDPTAALNDVDGDGIPNFQDLDSDADGVPDSCEARGHASPPASDLTLPVADTDSDGQPDFLDTDSDGDLLTDGQEDANHNCVVDACETDRTQADTDGDGSNDFVEATLSPSGACWANDAANSPAKAGILAVVEPYSSSGSAAPSPANALMGLSTAINKVDVAIIMDTTGSMGTEITALRSTLSTKIFPGLQAAVPDVAIGIAEHDDFPYGTYGSGACDMPFRVGTSVTTTASVAQAAVNGLTTHCGQDLPESQIPAMYAALTGSALTWPGGTTAPDTPPTGTYGAMHFRKDALGFVVEVTDAPMHDGKRALDKTGSSYDTTLQNAYSFTTFNADDAVAKFNALGAKFIGIAADGGARAMGTSNVYGYDAYLSDKTGSNVPPGAFGGTTCKTGVAGAALAPDGPNQQCRSVYSIGTNGTGIDGAIVSGVQSIAASARLDAYAQAYNDAGETSDVVAAFMDRIEPVPAGGTDPVTGKVCATFPATAVADHFTGPKASAGSDGFDDTAKAISAGSTYCFSLKAKPNSSVAATSAPKVFKAWIRLVGIKSAGGDTLALGVDRQLVFIVPPIAK